MEFLNKKQLAFILEITAEEARAKMCVAWCKSKGITNKAEMDGKKVIDDYPDAMPIKMLAEQLNLPTLQQSVDDIVTNFIIRPTSKKWILCDYPEKQVKKIAESGKKSRLSIPPALKSMLPTEAQNTIKEEWSKRYPKYA